MLLWTSIESGTVFTHCHARDLEINNPYKVYDVQLINTKYGTKVRMTLENNHIFLPDRYKKEINQDFIDDFNNNKKDDVFLTLLGFQNINENMCAYYSITRKKGYSMKTKCIIASIILLVIAYFIAFILHKKIQTLYGTRRSLT